MILHRQGEISVDKDPTESLPCQATTQSHRRNPENGVAPDSSAALCRNAMRRTESRRARPSRAIASIPPESNPLPFPANAVGPNVPTRPLATYERDASSCDLVESAYLYLL